MVVSSKAALGWGVGLASMLGSVAGFFVLWFDVVFCFLFVCECVCVCLFFLSELTIYDRAGRISLCHREREHSFNTPGGDFVDMSKYDEINSWEVGHGSPKVK